MFGVPPVPRSTGILLPGYEARIVREDGSDADYNEVGELWLKCTWKRAILFVSELS